MPIHEKNSVVPAPLVNKLCLLQKFPGKGGWTYAEIPEIPQDKHAPFGWVRVQGSIDGYPIRQYKLMPMGKGQLFLPVRAEIRKKIGKKAGDFVQVVLALDNSAVEIPDVLLMCLLDAPDAYAFFHTLSEGRQKAWIDWIFEAKQVETRANRIAKALDRLERGMKFYDQKL
jgi:bifunctional DNA-binding transcriptional regulator/antitoxin component of YhaV-PrlF toxin-antitoxin module